MLNKNLINLLKVNKKKILKSRIICIGDKDTDIECAENFLIRGHLYKSGNLLKFIKLSENL